MARVWVLGNGQLGAMLKQAANPLGITVLPVDIDSTIPIDLAPDDIVTAEREQWPETNITRQLANHPNFVNLDVFPTLADRLTQKQLIDRLHLATAPWQAVTTETTESGLFQSLGPKVLLKRRSGGYDGRGQHWLHAEQGSTIPNDWANHAIAEQAIPFDEELSLVGARDQAGNLYFYPLTLNLNTKGILRATVAPLSRLDSLQSKAENMLRALLNDLNYVGIMGMELFRCGDDILINELAPRVHNTGHWTQAGASIDQFEYHMRAVAGLPLTTAWVKACSVMINLIGSPWDPRWLQVPGVEVYWYHKSVRPGRKLGHINLCSSNKTELLASLEQLATLLAEDYQEPISWAMRQLKGG